MAARDLREVMTTLNNQTPLMRHEAAKRCIGMLVFFRGAYSGATEREMMSVTVRVPFGEPPFGVYAVVSVDANVWRAPLTVLHEGHPMRVEGVIDDIFGYSVYLTEGATLQILDPPEPEPPSATSESRPSRQGKRARIK